MDILKDRKSALFAAIVEQGEAAAPSGAARLTADDFRFLIGEEGNRRRAPFGKHRFRVEPACVSLQTPRNGLPLPRPQGG